MKVLLLRPNSIIIATPVPLGIAYVAESLRTRRGDDVMIVDARNLRLKPRQVAEKIAAIKPDVVGISAINFEAPQTHELARIAKEIEPESWVIVGGPYASANREAILDDPCVDLVAVGESENTAVEILDAIEKKDDLAGVPGIILRKNGKPHFTGPRPPIEDVDSLHPAWDLLDPESYFKRKGRNSENIIKYSHRTLTVFTSRGCPFNCIFCHNVFGRKFRARSPENVLDEITHLKEAYGMQELEIVDDSFNLDLARAKAICRGIIERDLNLKITLPNGIRGDRVDEELLDLFKDAGFYRIAYAVESASPRIQKIIRKQIDLEKVRWAITETARRKIMATGYFILGFPTETRLDMEMTARFAINSDLHVASFFYLNPFPGTEVARMTDLDLKDYTFRDYSTLTVNLSAESDDELRRICKRTYRRFYLSPRRIAHIIQVVPQNPRTFINAFLVLRLMFQDSVNQ
jgi:anaerobic magnesium-protoporphyrin IX monomethyl ester cyclase